MTASPRTLAIGDIHGCSRALDALLSAVSPATDELIITLGDYVDRGLDSAGVIDRLIQLDRTHRLIALRGNHEEMMMDAQRDPELLGFWQFDFWTTPNNTPAEGGWPGRTCPGVHFSAWYHGRCEGRGRLPPTASSLPTTCGLRD